MVKCSACTSETDEYEEITCRHSTETCLVILNLCKTCYKEFRKWQLAKWATTTFSATLGD